MSKKMKRRDFLFAAASVPAISVIPRSATGAVNFVSHVETINIAYIGTGTQGIRQLIELLPKGPRKNNFTFGGQP